MLAWRDTINLRKCIFLSSILRTDTEIYGNNKEHGKTFLELLGAADKALYYVKDHGRDGMYIYQS